MAVRSGANGKINAFIVCLCTCFLLGHKIDALISMEETCALYNGTYIADPSDCAGWGYCRGGALIAKGKCDSGYLYDCRSATCNKADEVECIVSKTNICKGLDAVYKPDPTDCQNYFYCTNGVAAIGRCPDNQYYSPDTDRCVWASTMPNCMAETPCLLTPSNTFVGVPQAQSCREYYRCVNNYGYLGTCDEGFVFNPSNGMCDKTTTMECPDKPIETVPSEQPPNIKEVCKAYDSKDGGDQFFSDGLSCPGYVVCTDSENGVWQLCPWSTHFDPDSKQCVTPYEVNCPFNRCKNMNAAFMAAYGTGCKKYVQCSGQLSSKTSESCASTNYQYPYFAENLGGCVQDRPVNQKICQ